MTIFFPDVSDFQAGLSLVGAMAVIAKATESDYWVGETYPGFKAQATQLGIPFAGYHFMDSADLQRQAEHAFGHIGPGVGTMWDAEASGDTVPRLLDLTSRYRALGGNPTLVYLPYWFWRDIGSPDLRPLAAAGLALISSSYPATGYSDDGVGWAPYGGMTPVIWQYTDAHSFNGQPVDFNAFEGTAAQLRAVIEGGTPVTTVDPTDETETEILSIELSKAAGLNSATQHGKPWNVNLVPGYEHAASYVEAALKPRLDAIDQTLADIQAKLAALSVPAGAASLTVSLSGTAVPTPVEPTPSA